MTEKERMAEKKLEGVITEILASCLSDNDVRPRVNEVFNAFKEAGYTRPAEELDPQAERFSWLIEHGWKPPDDNPEYEPVELEALGDEEIANRIKEEEIRNGVPEEYISINDSDLEYHKVISQATIRKNQAKGQLYRIRSEKE